MNAMPLIENVRREGPVLFSLLDAASDDGRLEDTPFQQEWLVLKNRIRDQTECEAAADECFALLQAIDAAGLIRATWIEASWRGALRRASRTAPV